MLMTAASEAFSNSTGMLGYALISAYRPRESRGAVISPAGIVAPRHEPQVTFRSSDDTGSAHDTGDDRRPARGPQRRDGLRTALLRGPGPDNRAADGRQPAAVH